jgi:hypothetical protein
MGLVKSTYYWYDTLRNGSNEDKRALSEPYSIFKVVEIARVVA